MNASKRRTVIVLRHCAAFLASEFRSERGRASLPGAAALAAALARIDGLCTEYENAATLVKDGRLRHLMLTRTLRLRLQRLIAALDTGHVATATPLLNTAWVSVPDLLDLARRSLMRATLQPDEVRKAGLPLAYLRDLRALTTTVEECRASVVRNLRIMAGTPAAIDAQIRRGRNALVAVDAALEARHAPTSDVLEGWRCARALMNTVPRAAAEPDESPYSGEEVTCAS